MYACQECGRKFKTTKAAESASRNGCPKCGGVDIDLDVPNPPLHVKYPGLVSPPTEAQIALAKRLTAEGRIL